MSNRQPRVQPQLRGGKTVFIYDGPNGEFAEFPELPQLEAYLTAMQVVAVWRGAPEECPQSPVLVLPEPKPEPQQP